jgi:hypothetical protein
MPALASTFADACAESLALATSAEALRIRDSTQGEPQLPLARLELLYELAFLRLFIAWEQFLEESLIRYLCGYAHRGGQENLRRGRYFSTLDGARMAIRQGRDYVLWHNPQTVVTRAQQWLDTSRHELVIGSSLGRLANFAAIRHRVAHAQLHARSEFDKATIVLVARRYRGSRPGRFLRDWLRGATPPKRWLARISDELIGLAHQIVPL